MTKTNTQNIFTKTSRGQELFVLRIKNNTRTLPLGTTIKQAQTELKHFRKELVDYKVEKTLNQYFNDYIKNTSNIHSEKTVKTKVAQWNKHISPSFGTFRPSQLRPHHLQKRVNDMLDDFSPKTVQNVLSIVSALYVKMIKNQFTDFNPCEAVDLPKFDNRRYFNMSEENIRKLINAIMTHPEPLWRGVFITLLHGRRLNEVLSLQWSDVDMSNKYYHIPYQNNKARKNMIYSMTDDLYETFEIQRLLNRYRTNEDDLVFMSNVTNRKIKDIRKAWAKIIKKADIEYIRIHDIRHMIGYYSINYLGIPIEHVAITLGHTNIVITQQYVNRKPEISRDVTKMILIGRTQS